MRFLFIVQFAAVADFDAQFTAIFRYLNFLRLDFEVAAVAAFAFDIHRIANIFRTRLTTERF